MKWLLLVSLLCDPCSSADHNIQWLKSYASQNECRKDAPQAIAKLRASNAAAYAAVKQSMPRYSMIYTCSAFTEAKP